MGTGSTGARARHRVVAFQQAKLKAGARGVRRAHEERGRRDAREWGDRREEQGVGETTHVAVPYIAAPAWLTSRTHWSAFDLAS